MKTLIKLFRTRIYSVRSMVYYNHNTQKRMLYSATLLFGRVLDSTNEPSPWI